MPKQTARKSTGGRRPRPPPPPPTQAQVDRYCVQVAGPRLLRCASNLRQARRWLEKALGYAEDLKLSQKHREVLEDAHCEPDAYAERGLWAVEDVLAALRVLAPTLPNRDDQVDQDLADRVRPRLPSSTFADAIQERFDAANEAVARAQAAFERTRYDCPSNSVYDEVRTLVNEGLHRHFYDVYAPRHGQYTSEDVLYHTDKC